MHSISGPLLKFECMYLISFEYSLENIHRKKTDRKNVFSESGFHLFSFDLVFHFLHGRSYLTCSFEYLAKLFKLVIMLLQFIRSSNILIFFQNLKSK